MGISLERMVLPLQLKIKKKNDFLILGSLCNNDLLLASQLTKMGFKIKIIRYRSEVDKLEDILLDDLGIDRKIITIYETKLSFIKECFSSRVIFNFSGSLVFFLGKYLFLLKFYFFPPVISYITGSDLMEEPFQKNLISRLYRFLFKNSYLLCLVPMKSYIAALKKLHIDRISFVRHPFLILKDKKIKKQKIKDTSKIIFAHISNIDWGESDNKAYRESTKGSDKFIRAFIRASRQFSNIKCIILDRGPDAINAKKIIEAANCSAFDWFPPCSQGELYKIFDKADVIIDQFDLGAFGGIAIEGMSYGKSLLTYADDLYLKGMFYNDTPPIFNASSENEILEKITYIAENPNILKDIGIKSKEWVIRNYDNSINFIDIFTMLDSKYGFNFLSKCLKKK